MLTSSEKGEGEGERGGRVERERGRGRERETERIESKVGVASRAPRRTKQGRNALEMGASAGRGRQPRRVNNSAMT